MKPLYDENIINKKGILQQNVRYIMEESYGSTNNDFVTSWVELQAFDSNDNNVALNKPIQSNFCPCLDVTGQTMIDTILNGNITLKEWVSVNISLMQQKPVKIIIDLMNLYSLEKIHIYHGWWTKRAYKNKLFVSDNGYDWTCIYSYLIDGLIFETKSQPFTIIL